MASSLLFKALIGTTTVGAIGGAGFATSYMLSGESIRTHIDNSNKSKNKVFLTKGTANLEDIKSKYTVYNGNKRLKPTGITADQLVKWCSDNVDSKFKDENDATYKSILAWCYINSKTIEEEMASRSKKLLSTQGANHEHWQNAWENYKNNKVAKKLEIKETAETDLNKADSNKTKGGPLLHKWCTETEKKKEKLYDGDTEETYAIFEAWCTANAG